MQDILIMKKLNDMIKEANKLEVTCEQSCWYAKPSWDEKGQSLQWVKIVEIDDEFNVINHVKAPKIVDLNDERSSMEMAMSSWVIKVILCCSNIDEDEDPKEKKGWHDRVVHYRRGKENLPEMCIKYENGDEELTPMLDYYHKLEGEEDKIVDFSNDGLQKAWDIGDRIVEFPEGSIQYSNEDDPE